MASVRSRNRQDEKNDDEFRNWRSPHHKTSDHFRKHDRHHEQQGQGETRDRRDRERYSCKSDRRGSSDNNAGHRTRYRESKPHRWTSDKRTPDGNKKMDLKSSSEFPALGAKDMKTRSSFTPDVVRPPTQRRVRTTSANWADKIVQFEQDKQRAMKDMMKYKRRLLMSQSSDGSNEDQDLHKVDMNSEPKKEYETDEIIIVRRQKQVEYGKNTLGYDNYLQEVPKNKRVKGKHMSTPNKFHKCSRRAWEGLVRQWRKKLHEYDPEDSYKPDTVARKELHFSDTTSEASSTDTDGKMDIDLNNSSLSSAISDYLASNESSRPETPESVDRPQTPTTELKGLSVSDHINGNCPEVKIEKSDVATPDTTLTPTVTPADHEVEDNNNHQPQFNPGDLLAALHQASQNMQPPPQVMPATFNLNLQCARPPLVPYVIPDVNSLPCPNGVKANQQIPKKSKKGDIFDNFNLDDCFNNDENHDVQ